MTTKTTRLTHLAHGGGLLCGGVFGADEYITLHPCLVTCKDCMFTIYNLWRMKVANASDESRGTGPGTEKAGTNREGTQIRPGDEGHGPAGGAQRSRMGDGSEK